MFMKCLCLTYLSNMRCCCTSADTHFTHCLCRLFAAKIDLKFQPKITSKNILASKKKILGEFSHVFHTVYVLYGT